MFKSLLKIWKANHGNLLLMLGLAAAVLMSIVWTAKLLPDIELIPETNLDRRLPQDTRPALDLFRIMISGPPRAPGSDVGPRGFVHLYFPEGELTERPAVLHSRPFELDSNGFDVVTINRIEIRAYAVMAYLDINGNETLDFGVSSFPAEPLRYSTSPSATPKTLNLAEASITPPSDKPLVIRFEFPIKGAANDTMERIMTSTGK